MRIRSFLAAVVIMIMAACSNPADTFMDKYAVVGLDGEKYSYENAPDSVLTPEQIEIKKRKQTLDYEFIDVDRKSGRMSLTVSKPKFIKGGNVADDYDYLKAVVRYNNSTLPEVRKQMKKTGSFQMSDIADVWEQARAEFFEE